MNMKPSSIPQSHIYIIKFITGEMTINENCTLAVLTRFLDFTLEIIDPHVKDFLSSLVSSL